MPPLLSPNQPPFILHNPRRTHTHSRFIDAHTHRSALSHRSYDGTEDGFTQTGPGGLP
ncbi:hypothetical protein HMPREF9621_02047 [Cutibacterium modestum HL037PA2]|uniref:Uncharacterized protein n=1 Tax=Cutibacterium modestum HL044PA1 TaxID=765109 RepID=A0ABN0C1F1_9ACTN|nr:hypothetical protein HMPREF9621_02047 [Cutibacterium modestum HL037PA2]EFS90958.1 hypothetical protein HMPREF9607_02797 [Cutibacterium modestum HL044PA1]